MRKNSFLILIFFFGCYYPQLFNVEKIEPKNDEHEIKTTPTDKKIVTSIVPDSSDIGGAILAMENPSNSKTFVDIIFGFETFWTVCIIVIVVALLISAIVFMYFYAGVSWMRSLLEAKSIKVDSQKTK